MARAPAVVHRQDRDLGRVVRRQHRARRSRPCGRRRSGRSCPIHAIDSEFQGAGLAARLPRGAGRRGRLGPADDRHAAAAAAAVRRRLAASAGATRIEAIEQPFPFAWHVVPPETWAAWTTDIAAIEVPTLAVSAWHDSYPRETVDYWRAAGRREAAASWGRGSTSCPTIAVHDPIGFFEVVAAVVRRTSWATVRRRCRTSRRSRSSRALGRGWRTADAWPPAAAAVADAVRRARRRRSAMHAADAAADDDVSRRPDRRAGGAAVGLDDADAARSRATSRPTITARRRGPATPLDEPLLITGDPAVVVALCSDRPDVPLRAWLSDVRPDGSSTLITQGWVRPTHVLGGPLPADRPAEVRVPLNPTSYRLAAGHRLRLAVAGSHFPALVPRARPGDVHDRGRPERHARRTAGRAARRGRRRRRRGRAPSDRSAAGASSSRRGRARRRARPRRRRRGATTSTRRARFALEAGGELTWDIAVDARPSRATIPARCGSRSTADLADRRPAGRRSRSASRMWQTFDEQEVTAEIDVDGQPFFERDLAPALRRRTRGASDADRSRASGTPTLETADPADAAPPTTIALLRRPTRADRGHERRSTATKWANAGVSPNDVATRRGPRDPAVHRKARTAGGPGRARRRSARTQAAPPTHSSACRPRAARPGTPLRMAHDPLRHRGLQRGRRAGGVGGRPATRRHPLRVHELQPLRGRRQRPRHVRDARRVRRARSASASRGGCSRSCRTWAFRRPSTRRRRTRSTSRPSRASRASTRATSGFGAACSRATPASRTRPTAPRSRTRGASSRDPSTARARRRPSPPSATRPTACTGWASSRFSPSSSIRRRATASRPRTAPRPSSSSRRFKREAHPLIRFRTHDLVRLTTTPCRCGRTGVRFHVLGRSDDMFIVRGINVFPLAVAAIVDEFRPAPDRRVPDRARRAAAARHAAAAASSRPRRTCRPERLARRRRRRWLLGSGRS